MKAKSFSQICLATLTFAIAVSASASNLSERGPLVAEWIKDLPPVSNLMGDAGCEAIQFPTENGIVALQIGNAVSQPWLGIDGTVQMDKTNFMQDYTGGGIDIPRYRFQVMMAKANGQLQTLSYRAYKVTGFIFTHEELEKQIDCQGR